MCEAILWIAILFVGMMVAEGSSEGIQGERFVLSLCVILILTLLAYYLGAFTFCK